MAITYIETGSYAMYNKRWEIPPFLGVPSTPKLIGIASSHGGTLKLAANGLYVGVHDGFGVGVVFTYGSNNSSFVFIHENLSNSGWGASSISYNKSTDTLTNNSSSSMFVIKII